MVSRSCLGCTSASPVTAVCCYYFGPLWFLLEPPLLLLELSPSVFLVSGKGKEHVVLLQAGSVLGGAAA